MVVDLVVWRCCRASEVGVVVPDPQEQKSPVNRCLQGRGRGVEVLEGGRGCWFGRLVVSRMCTGVVVGLSCQSAQE